MVLLYKLKLISTKSNKINITNDIKKFKIDVDRAIIFMFVKEIPFSLFTKMASTPSIGVKSKDVNNIYKTKKNIFF